MTRAQSSNSHPRFLCNSGRTIFQEMIIRVDSRSDSAKFSITLLFSKLRMRGGGGYYTNQYNDAVFPSLFPRVNCIIKYHVII